MIKTKVQHIYTVIIFVYWLNILYNNLPIYEYFG